MNPNAEFKKRKRTDSLEHNVKRLNLGPDRRRGLTVSMQRSNMATTYHSDTKAVNLETEVRDATLYDDIPAPSASTDIDEGSGRLTKQALARLQRDLDAQDRKDKTQPYQPPKLLPKKIHKTGSLAGKPEGSYDIIDLTSDNQEADGYAQRVIEKDERSFRRMFANFRSTDP